MAPWADVVFGCDRLFWDEHAKPIRDKCSGEFWTINEHAAKVHGLNYMGHEKGGGISRNPNTIREGGNSGFQAVGLALLFGAARITLLGYDMQFTGGRKHWHADHAKNNPTTISLRGWRQNFGELSRATDVPIINATRETGLTCFPRMGLNESLASIA
jgi:hypothetical protein